MRIIGEMTGADRIMNESVFVGVYPGLSREMIDYVIDSIRRFDPADQRPTDKADSFALLPASEALLDAESITRFRSEYRATFGATATQDPLYQALSEGRRMAGMEHWLPMLEERLASLFDHLGEHDLILRDSSADKALDARREAIADYHQNRVRAMAAEPGNYRPLAPDALYLSASEWGRITSVTKNGLPSVSCTSRRANAMPSSSSSAPPAAVSNACMPCSSSP